RRSIRFLAWLNSRERSWTLAAVVVCSESVERVTDDSPSSNRFESVVCDTVPYHPTAFEKSVIKGKAGRFDGASETLLLIGPYTARYKIAAVSARVTVDLGRKLSSS